MQTQPVPLEPNNQLAWGLSTSGELLIRLAKETSLPGLMNLILTEAQGITGAEGGTFYRVSGEDDAACLKFAAIRNSALDIHIYNVEATNSSGWRPIPLYIDGQPNHANVASFVALTKETVIIEDAYETSNFDFTGTRVFDESHHYRSRSIMAVPLLNHDQQVIGVMQLLNARNPEGLLHTFSTEDQATVEAMAKFAAITLDNHKLVDSHKNLLDAFIKALAQIIDVRSPHTSAHCQRIPVLTELIAGAACEQKTGYFRDFNLDQDGWYELNVAAWLHDCGKLATSENVLNKGTKLQSLHDGVNAIRARFATRVAYAESEEERARIRSELIFIERINMGGEFMSEDEKDQIRAIALTTWQDALGQEQATLSSDEVVNLCITRGTINEDERAHINRHINLTIEVLEKLPFPAKLKRVPEYAGGHHERMDGRGYPKGLTRDQMSIPARIMGVADVFEALTAKERPYKPPMPLSQAFSILRKMKDDNHIDPDVFELFLTSGVWRGYAQEHMLAAQIDVDDIKTYLL
ncbi:HD domain-containing phosphohydrolase [Reinekea sp.]|jgi:HD-GYP domain-containing protein (c-di-GMP phosphodiesterase class II)|uniref:HD domain-containing phosphohydrolase n=1 Tax=Reinekea sp. TaxID=1970455 RepID=UPI002A806F10|nr:HD domain-containing phosphohydrolase [Reinekea sp.]